MNARGFLPQAIHKRRGNPSSCSIGGSRPAQTTELQSPATPRRTYFSPGGLGAPNNNFVYFFELCFLYRYISFWTVYNFYDLLFNLILNLNLFNFFLKFDYLNFISSLFFVCFNVLVDVSYMMWLIKHAKIFYWSRFTSALNLGSLDNLTKFEN